MLFRSSWRFDDRARLIEYVDRDGGITRQEWDDADNRTVLVEPDGRRSTWDWGDCNGEDEWTRQCDAFGNCTEQELDDACRVTLRRDPLGGEKRIEYDAQGQLSARIDAVGEVHEVAFDSRGLLARQSDPAGGAATSEYGDFGEVLAETRRDGIRRAFPSSRSGSRSGRTPSSTRRRSNASAAARASPCSTTTT